MYIKNQLTVIKTLTIAELKSRYRNTFAGLLWVMINPLILFSVHALIFKHILKLCKKKNIQILSISRPQKLERLLLKGQQLSIQTNQISLQISQLNGYLIIATIKHMSKFCRINQKTEKKQYKNKIIDFFILSWVYFH